uniref:SFRICE_029057 n=1 Tax=Spodoptera frugiperda TaxID=7108 RepID=A0A2H1WWQ7_SPOFR
MSQIETTDLTAPELRVSINSLVQRFPNPELITTLKVTGAPAQSRRKLALSSVAGLRTASKGSLQPDQKLQTRAYDFVLLLTENAQQYFAGPGNRSRYLLPSSSTCNHSSNEFVLKVLLLYINVFGE